MVVIESAFQRASIENFLEDCVDELEIAFLISQDMPEECCLIVSVSHGLDALAGLTHSIEL
jgi:hypothetical protein